MAKDEGVKYIQSELSVMAMFKWSEYERWMKQAEKTLRSALRDLEGGDYEWASFKAQQAAELAVKALLRGMGFAPIGHSITRLLRNLRDEGVEVPKGAVPQGYGARQKLHSSPLSRRLSGGFPLRVLF